MNAPKDDAKRLRGVGRGGRFFVIERAAWDRVFETGIARERLSVALTYLVIAAGTGADNVTSSWSATAVSRHTGLRKDSAHEAIRRLTDRRLVAEAPDSTSSRPRYKLNIDSWPIIADERDRPPIFLPTGLVTGVSDADTSMLWRLREVGDPLVLRLLIDLYGEVVTDATFAVSPAAWRGHCDPSRGPSALPAMRLGANTIWALSDTTHEQTVSLDRKRYRDKSEPAEGVFWPRVRALFQIGALQEEPWLFSHAGPDAAPIFPIASDIGRQADAVARRLIASKRPGDEDLCPPPLVILPSHHQAPALLKVARLRLEADTQARRYAYRQREALQVHWIEQLARLLADDSAGNYANPLKSQPRQKSH